VKPLVFHIEAAGESRPVELKFATESEVRGVRAWNKTKPTDAGEFAALAAKRWFYYAREDSAIESLTDLKKAIRRNERSELAFLLLATAPWARRYKYLALAYCRRTWCNHLVLDFLAVRPGLKVSNQPVFGLGAGILVALTHLANSLNCDSLWGEATASSAPFYEKVLGTSPIKDLFVIDREMMSRVQTKHREKQNARLANAPNLKHPR
jgi:hypothetical protein